MSYSVRFHRCSFTQTGNATASFRRRSTRYRLSRFFFFKQIGLIRRAYMTFHDIMNNNTDVEKRRTANVLFRLANYFGMIILFFATSALSSCGGDDDEPMVSNDLIGTWTYEYRSEGPEDGEYEEEIITLKFDKDNKGLIVREESYPIYTGLIGGDAGFSGMQHNTYSMKCGWSTSTNSDGKDILIVSYVSGDKKVWPFPGTFQYLLMDNILEISDDRGNRIRDFNKKE